MSPSDLAHVLSHLPKSHDERLIAGLETSDDSGVYQVSDTLALVQTVDIFPPVVDDPYWYGAIAAANAMSDVYAMGGRPLTALNLVGWPEDLDQSIMVEVLRGGSDKLAEAGATLVGGHSWYDAEPKYGLSITGVIEPSKVVTNAAAQPGDALLLTKPLGLGIITTGAKAEQAGEGAIEEAIAVMAGLNRGAAEAMQEVGVHAATDVTGFGLLGHLREMMAGSHTAAEIDLQSVPILPEARRLVSQGVVPGGTRRNLDHLRQFVDFGQLAEETRLLLADAQTSGGLLIAVQAGKVDRLIQLLQQKATPVAVQIGRVLEEPAGSIVVR